MAVIAHKLYPIFFYFSWAKDGAPHSESFSRLGTPILSSLYTSLLNIDSCTIGAGYVHEHTVLASLSDSKSTGLGFHVPRVQSNRSSNILRRSIGISCYSGSRCWHCLVINLFRSDFSYFSSNILRICRIELTVLSD